MRNYVKLFIATGFVTNPTPPPDFNLSIGPSIFTNRSDMEQFLQQNFDHTESNVFYVKLDQGWVAFLLQMGASFSAPSQVNASGQGSSLWYDNFKIFLAAGAANPEERFGNIFIPDSPRASGINSRSEIPS